MPGIIPEPLETSAFGGECRGIHRRWRQPRQMIGQSPLNNLKAHTIGAYMVEPGVRYQALPRPRQWLTGGGAVNHVEHPSMGDHQR